jgi:cytochrome c oxidase subunit IV
MEGQGHPNVGTYVRVFAVLVIVTIIEVGVFYVPAFQPFLVPTLLVLSTLKFVLVVLFYMHLKTDSPFYSFLFGGPLLLATAVLIGLLLLFYGALRLRIGV